MDMRKSPGTSGLAGAIILLSAMAMAAHAQTASSTPQAAPGVLKVAPPAKAEATPVKPASPVPSLPAAKSTLVTQPPIAAADSTITDVNVGAAVFGSDGQKIGEIKGVKADPAGKIEEIHVRTGGAGSKIVVIPGGKIIKGGQTVQVAMTAAEAGKSPAAVDKKG